MFDSDELVELEEPGMVRIMPLKDFHIVHNDDNIVIVEGEEIEVPKVYLQNLKTEKVI